MGRPGPADCGRTQARRPESPRLPEGAAARAARRAAPSASRRGPDARRPDRSDARPERLRGDAVGLDRGRRARRGPRRRDRRVAHPLRARARRVRVEPAGPRLGALGRSLRGAGRNHRRRGRRADRLSRQRDRGGQRVLLPRDDGRAADAGQLPRVQHGRDRLPLPARAAPGADLRAADPDHRAGDHPLRALPEHPRRQPRVSLYGVPAPGRRLAGHRAADRRGSNAARRRSAFGLGGAGEACEQLGGGCLEAGYLAVRACDQ